MAVWPTFIWRMMNFLDRDVTFKMMRLDMQADADLAKRFQHEALAATELVNDNIVQVYDVGEYEGSQYIVMEYVEGTDLKSYIQEHFPIPYQQVVDIMMQVLNAVQAAHNADIIHRDLKPQNILIDSTKSKSKSLILVLPLPESEQDSSLPKQIRSIGSVLCY
jgi:eukaryotic-like serine/threonine-protein kinase